MMVVAAHMLKHFHPPSSNTPAIEPHGGGVLKSRCHLLGAGQALVPGCW